MSTKHRIIFLGTPDFAAESLKVLITNDFHIVAVITAPDKPKGRGKKIGMSAVKEIALEHSLPILQPTNLKSEDFLKELKSYKADLQIVVAFRMLPEVVWNMPPLGTFNLHASLLPQYRGAAPINWAIINGETQTGVTTFFLKHEIDTGSIVFQETEPIKQEDTVGDLYIRLMKKGAQLVVKTAHAIQEGNYPQRPQAVSEELRHAPKIFKEDCKIDWNKPGIQIINFIRGLSPYPAAWTIFDDKVLKIYKATASNGSLASGPGANEIKDLTLTFQSADLTIEIQELQIEGKKRMLTADFLRGYKQ